MSALIPLQEKLTPMIELVRLSWFDAVEVAETCPTNSLRDVPRNPLFQMYDGHVLIIDVNSVPLVWSIPGFLTSQEQVSPPVVFLTAADEPRIPCQRR